MRISANFNPWIKVYLKARPNVALAICGCKAVKAVKAVKVYKK